MMGFNDYIEKYKQYFTKLAFETNSDFTSVACAAYQKYLVEKK